MTNLNEQLRTIIKQEFKKCAVDAEYFLRKYCIIQHPLRGKINFDLYPFQSSVLHELVQDQNVIILKSRQIGMSTLVAGYALWLTLFHTGKNVLVIATKQDTAKNIVTKVRLMHSNLPVWLRGQVVEDNKLSLEFKNGSKVKAVSSSPDAGRSEALSLLILDEAAHIDPPELADEIWEAASSAAERGKIVILSTPNGMGNFFHRMWVAAKNGENKFKPIELDWKVHPEHDQAWRDEQTKKLGELVARQEHDADFIASGNTVISGDLIQLHRKKHAKLPVERRGFDRNLWIWEYPDYNKSYMVVADVGRGDESAKGDKSAFHVLDIDATRQVAEYKGIIGTKEYGAMLCSIATEYNNALLVVENSGVGWAVLQEIINRQYRNLFYMEQDLRFVDPKLLQLKNRYYRMEKNSVPGFTTSNKTRPLIISKLDEYMRDGSVEIQSPRTYDELEVFIWHGTRAEAMAGYNDDLVMALCIGLWVRDTALKLRQYGIDITKATIDAVTKRDYHDVIYTDRGSQPNPFQFPIGGAGLGQPGNPAEVEDLRWLLR